MRRDPLAWLNDELAALDAAGLFRQQLAHHGAQSAVLNLAGREVVQFASNDYLGLAGDPRLAAAAQQAIERYGFGGGASPLVGGRSGLHEALERRLAAFLRAEAAIVFASGYAANVGTIPALVGRGDAIYSDELNHASIIDGCRLSRAAVHVYRHGDVEHVAQLLESSGGFCRRLIVTDSLFSMDGDVAPLGELADLAERHSAMLMVDEAHAIGVFGDGGRGMAEALAVEARIDVRLGTLSKALGGSGGFVAGRRALVEWLINRARSYIFSTASEAAVAAAALAAIDVVESEPSRRTALLERARLLRVRLAADGWNVGQSQSQIVPVIVGSAEAAVRMSAELLERGVWAPAIRPPSVREGASRLRISLSHAHTDAMIVQLVAAMAELRAGAALSSARGQPHPSAR